MVHIPGIPVQRRPPAPVRQASSSENQVALTSAALAHWGKKVVTWGKIHKGDSYETTYEQDECYVRWVLARVGSLHEALEDFGNVLCHHASPTGDGHPADQPVSQWERIPESKRQFWGNHMKDFKATVEAGWLKDVCKLLYKCKQLYRPSSSFCISQQQADRSSTEVRVKCATFFPRRWRSIRTCRTGRTSHPNRAVSAQTRVAFT